MQKKVSEFFKSHPGVDTVYGALGVLFLEHEKADKFVGGTDQPVDVYTREEKPSKKVDTGFKHVVTEEDIINNPDLSTQGVKVGDEITVPNDPNADSNKEKAPAERVIKAPVKKSATAPVKKAAAPKKGAAAPTKDK